MPKYAFFWLAKICGGHVISRLSAYCLEHAVVKNKERNAHCCKLAQDKKFENQLKESLEEDQEIDPQLMEMYEQDLQQQEDDTGDVALPEYDKEQEEKLSEEKMKIKMET